MKFVVFICGLLMGAIGGVALLIYLQSNAPQQEVVFAKKKFYDARLEKPDGFVVVSGTITGEGLAYPNNTHSISCWRDRMTCTASSIDQIAPNHVGRLNGPWLYPVRKWDDYEIVASDDASAIACTKITITISRKLESVLWVEEPINQTRINCVSSETRIRKLTLEDPGWPKLLGPK